MRKTILLLTSLFITLPLLNSQSVDSIRLEQSGDLIKVHYRILDSKPTQIFRVSVLCSINGGLKSQLNSLSGDFGDNVTGGRDSYLILWDVLKDVEELSSAEFFIKAELVRDLAIEPADNSFKLKIKNKFHIMPGIEVPGPRVGLRIGYAGNFGVSLQMNYGNIPVVERFQETEKDGRTSGAGISFDLTKRIVISDSFQMHLMGGFTNKDICFYWPGPPSPVLWAEGEDGAEAGLLFTCRKFAGSLIISHYFASKNENGTELDIASPENYFSACIGICF